MLASELFCGVLRKCCGLRTTGTDSGERKMAEEVKPTAASSGTDGEEKPSEPQKEPVKEMRACVLTGFGGLKTVKVQKKPEPTAGEEQVLVRVRAR